MKDEAAVRHRFDRADAVVVATLVDTRVVKTALGNKSEIATFKVDKVDKGPAKQGDLWVSREHTSCGRTASNKPTWFEAEHGPMPFSRRWLLYWYMGEELEISDDGMTFPVNVVPGSLKILPKLAAEWRKTQHEKRRRQP